MYFSQIPSVCCLLPPKNRMWVPPLHFLIRANFREASVRWSGQNPMWLDVIGSTSFFLWRCHPSGPSLKNFQRMKDDRMIMPCFHADSHVALVRPAIGCWIFWCLLFCCILIPPFSTRKIHRSKKIHRFNISQIWTLLNRCIFFSIDVFFWRKGREFGEAKIHRPNTSIYTSILRPGNGSQNEHMPWILCWLVFVCGSFIHPQQWKAARWMGVGWMVLKWYAGILKNNVHVKKKTSNHYHRGRYVPTKRHTAIH